MNTYHITAVFMALIAAFTPAVSAVESESDAAGRLAMHELAEDTRVQRLRTYLVSHNSPLTEEAKTFVEQADKNDLDWKLVAAIAGTESTFGKHIPPGSYNAWGWGIPTGAQSGIGFKTWEEGIETVSEGLAKNYYGKGAKTIYDVGWIYAANGISWGNHVTFFMNKIETFMPRDAELLEISI